MSYINKALKDFVTLLKNDYQMEVREVRADATGGKKDYYLTVDLAEDKSRVLFISINHCTRTRLHTPFLINGKYEYTLWSSFGSKGRDTIRYAECFRIELQDDEEFDPTKLVVKFLAGNELVDMDTNVILNHIFYDGKKIEWEDPQGYCGGNWEPFIEEYWFEDE